MVTLIAPPDGRDVNRTDRDKASRAPTASSLPPYIRELYRTLLLDPTDETRLFRLLSDVKAEIGRLEQHVTSRHVSTESTERLAQLRREQQRLRNDIAEANLRLVVSIAKKFSGPGQPEFDELVAEGNMVLLKTIDYFKIEFGNRFSTYATTAIRRHFSRYCQREQRKRQQFVTVGEPLDTTDESGDNPTEDLIADPTTDAKLHRMLDQLSERERQIVQARYGFVGGKRRRSFRELGESLGLSKERVRQLHVRAMEKLRAAAATTFVDSPAA